jgi:hypothetical protein
MAVLGKISKECLAVGNYRVSGPPIYSILYKYKYLVANATFFIFISQIGIETSTFIYSNFAWGMHGGVDVM